jgi:lysophospholipase L1-like esterase
MSVDVLSQDARGPMPAAFLQNGFGEAPDQGPDGEEHGRFPGALDEDRAHRSNTAGGAGRGAATARTFLLFYGLATLLAVAPGLPGSWRLVDAATPQARMALWSSLVTRPRTTLGAQEQALLAGTPLPLVGDDDEGAGSEEAPLLDEQHNREARIDVVDAVGRAVGDDEGDAVGEDNDDGEMIRDHDVVPRRVSLPSDGRATTESRRTAFLRTAQEALSEHDRGLEGLRLQLKMPGASVVDPCREGPQGAGEDDGYVDGDGGGESRARRVCGRTALHSFFRALDALTRDEPGARAGVVVLGNSLIASDHTTDVLRRDLVRVFGDAGRGLLLPERLSKSVVRRSRSGRGSEGWVARTFHRDGDGVVDDVFGLTGSLHEASNDGEVTAWSPAGSTLGQLWWLDAGEGLRVEADGVEVLRVDVPTPSKGSSAGAHDGAPLSAWARGDRAEVTTRVRPRLTAFRVPAGTREVRLVAGRGARVYGVTLEREQAGVILDTIGIPAASASSFVHDADPATLAAQLRARDPALVMILLGGNETRSMALGLMNDEQVAQSFSQLLARVKTAAPSSSCMLVAPIDSATTTTASDVLVTRPQIHRVIATIRRVALANGCAFFDLFAAMGGEGSLERMREAHLVAHDLVHPRGRGGDILGALLSRALLLSWQKAPPTIDEPPTREPLDTRRPHFVGLSFPEEDRIVVDDDDDDDARRRPRALAHFFARLHALEEGQLHRVAIGQFGASHTAGQMLTDRVRALLGERFGEAGRGSVAAGPSSKRLAPSGVFRDVIGLYDLADGREVTAGGAVGMAGTKLKLAPGSRFRIGFCAGCPPRSVTGPGRLSIAWLYTPDMGVADVFVDGALLGSLHPSARRPDGDVQHLSVPILSERASLEVVVRAASPHDKTAGGPVHVLSVAQDMDRRGVVVDASGLPGTTGMTPQRWRQDLLADEVRARDYDLVVTAWGTNEAGLASLDEETYRHHFAATLKTLLAAAPRADCLILGATDRFDLHGDALVAAPSHALVERVQRGVAAAHGCAFFSFRDAMGGPGSMRRWVREGRARADHVHFTREGYGDLATLLVQDLLAALRWSASDPRRPGDLDDVLAWPSSSLASAGEPESAIDDG